MEFPNNLDYIPVNKIKKSKTEKQQEEKKKQDISEALDYNNIKQVKTQKVKLDVEKIIQKARKVKEEGSMKKAIKFGIVGLGQAGGRMAETFETLNYPTIAINTSPQDLEKCNCSKKLEIGDIGAGKDLKIGRTAVNRHRSNIMKVYQNEFSDIDHALVVAGSSGGTGGGGLESVIETLLNFKKPVGVLTTLPLSSEDTRAKKNTLSVLNRLVDLNRTGKIKPLIIIDNNKIEKNHPGLSTLKFWRVANEEVVKTFDLFNRLSATSSEYSSLDPADYRKIINSGGCMIFGNIAIEEINVEDIGLISKAITNNIDSGLLVEGFDLTESTHVGCMIVGNPKQIQEIPRAMEEDAFNTINQVIGSGSVYKGVYGLERLSYPEVFFMFSGLGLPEKRFRDLISDVKTETKHFEEKATHRTVSDILQDMGEEGLDIDLDASGEEANEE